MPHKFSYLLTYLQQEAGMDEENLDGHFQTRSEGHGQGTTWDEAQRLVTNSVEWCQRVAQCIHRDVE